MIERLSRVLCKCDGIDPDASLLPVQQYGFAWQAYKKKARAVLSEMRCVSHGMEARGTIEIQNGEDSVTVFRSMINVALVE